MTNLKHIFYFSAVSLLLASCSGYGVISENDVYLQKPAAIDLTDEEQDITSFNTYKAGKQGAFENGDQRLRNTNARIFIVSSSPFAFNNSMFNPYYGYSNPFGYNDPFGWNRPYGMYNSFGPGWGWGHGYGYGLNQMYGYYGYYNGYQYGTFMSPYYCHNHYGINYIGPNSNHGINNWNNNSNFYGSGSSNMFYGQRRSLSGNSGRSSTYPQTLKNKMHSNQSASNAGVYSRSKYSSQNIQRRKVDNSQREYVRSNVNASRSSSSNYSGSSRNINATSANDRRATSSSNNYNRRSYAPSQSARRSGTVSRSNTNSRSTNSYNSSGGSRGTYNSSSNSNRGNYNSGSSNSRGSYSSPQRSSGGSYNRSSGSSSRSSGSSSSRGGSSSRSGGRR